MDWSKVTAFHMDEYVGLRGDQPESFRHYLSQHLLQHAPIGRFWPLPAEEPDLDAVCARYASGVCRHPIPQAIGVWLPAAQGLFMATPHCIPRRAGPTSGL